MVVCLLLAGVVACLLAIDMVQFGLPWAPAIGGRREGSRVCDVHAGELRWLVSWLADRPVSWSLMLHPVCWKAE